MELYEQLSKIADETRRIIKEANEETKALIETKFENIDYRFDELKLQEDKNNKRFENLESRVSVLEKLPCKSAERIRTIEDVLLQKKAIAKWLFVTIGITSTVLGIIAGFMKLFGNW